MENIKNDSETRKVFARRLKKLRLDMEITLEELTEKFNQRYNMDVTFGSLGNYERGYRIPSILVLNKLADFFDVSTDYLLGNTEVKNAKVLQTSIFDTNNVEHTVKIGVDKDSDLAHMPLSEIRNLLLKLKDLGINFDTIIK